MEIGKQYEVDFPFVRIVDGEYKRWKPGFERELEYPDGGSSYTMATGMGKALIEIVAICDLPGRYHQRVFFKRKWKAPDGSIFGACRLEVKTKTGVRKLLEGVHVEDYDEKYMVVEAEQPPRGE